MRGKIDTSTMQLHTISIAKHPIMQMPINEAICKMHDDITKALGKCHYYMPDNVSMYNLELQREAYNWFCYIYDHYYLKWEKVRSLLPEETWKRYKVWGSFMEHQEVILLKTAERLLRNAVTSTKKPRLLTKGYYDKEMVDKEDNKTDTQSLGLRSKKT